MKKFWPGGRLSRSPPDPPMGCDKYDSDIYLSKNLIYICCRTVFYAVPKENNGDFGCHSKLEMSTEDYAVLEALWYVSE